MSEAKDSITLEVVKGQALSATQRTALVALCNRAYGEDVENLFGTYADPVHVLAYLGSTLVSHALWTTRWLSYEDGPLMRTAFVEMVATEPDYQGRGYASLVMVRLAAEILDFDFAALWPNFPGWYARLGWVSWQGPLFIRTEDGLLSTPDDEIMVRFLPGTPPLDPNGSLSAEWREGELW